MEEIQPHGPAKKQNNIDDDGDKKIINIRPRSTNRLLASFPLVSEKRWKIMRSVYGWHVVSTSTPLAFLNFLEQGYRYKLSSYPNFSRCWIVTGPPWRGMYLGT